MLLMIAPILFLIGYFFLSLVISHYYLSPLT